MLHILRASSFMPSSITASSSTELLSLVSHWLVLPFTPSSLLQQSVIHRPERHHPYCEYHGASTNQGFIGHPEETDLSHFLIAPIAHTLPSISSRLLPCVCITPIFSISPKCYYNVRWVSPCGPFPQYLRTVLFPTIVNKDAPGMDTSIIPASLDRLAT